MGRRLHFEPLELRQLLAGLTAVPLAGDFNGTGMDSLGYYDTATGTFFARNDNTSGFATTSARFGPAAGTGLPIVGDWDGDGDDTPGLYDPASGTFFLTDDFAAGPADHQFRFGPTASNWLPLAGDFDGDGSDTVGLFAPTSGEFFVRNTLTSGPADSHFRLGPKNDNWQPFSGDFNNNGTDTVGLYDPDEGKFFLKNSLTGGVADEVFGFGPKNRGWLPLLGDFDGNGSETPAVLDPLSEKLFVSDSRSPGMADREIFIAPAIDAGSPGIAGSATPPFLSPMASAPPLTAAEVRAPLRRAAAASPSTDAIIAVVDRGGKILGVRAEAGVLATIVDPDTLVFAVDGAVAKARTAAFFGNGDPDNATLAPLNSRLVRFISQSTITQREVESNPNSADPTVRGPGFVAPVGLGGHFPPEILHTPVVDLFAIEHTNRDSIVHPGADGTRSAVTLNAAGDVIAVSGDDILLPSRFNVDPAFIPLGQQIAPPESYGLASGRSPAAQSRGIATLPGGIPLYKDSNSDGIGDTLVGGIGVFFPGPDGYATHEQNFIAGIGQSENERTNAAKVLEAEWIAFAAAGGSAAGGVPVGTIAGEPPIPDFDLPFGRLTLVGIELEVFGPHPDGLWELRNVGIALGTGDATSGADQPVNVSGTLHLPGVTVPEGWLVLPHGSTVDPISAADVLSIIEAGIAEADLVRAAVRLPLSSRTRMVFAVADTEGNVLGLYRMKDATVFSIDVAVAKARNTAYYADATALAAVDRIDGSIPPDGIPDVPAGVAMTNRTFRYLAEPRFPDGVDFTNSSPFSILNDPGTNPATAENSGAPAAFTDHTSVLGHDAFFPGTNFRDPDNIANQNGIVFFPGSTPLYEAGGTLIGGLGVSGDGVDQDDVVTFFAAQGFLPPSTVTRADEVQVRGVRLPFIKFLRNPEG